MAGLSSMFKSLIALCSAQSTGGSCEFRRKSSNRVYSRNHTGRDTLCWCLEPVTPFGLMPTQNTNDNDEIGGDRMAQGVSRGTIDVGGDVGTKFRWNQHDDFLASCFGADWLDNVLTMGNNRITFSVSSYADDVGIAQIARGCQVATFQIEIPNDGDITATITFAGLDWETKADDTTRWMVLARCAIRLRK